MKKPEWFELVDNDHDEPYVGNKIPFIALLVIIIVVSGFIFLFPSKTNDKPATNEIKIIQTPNVPEFTEDITPVWEEEENEDQEDD